jgi:hypothetical protein
MARWPGHQDMNTKTEGEGVELTAELAEELGGRPWRRHRWRSHGCGGEATVQWLRRQGAAPCSRPNGQAQHHTWGVTPGLQACLPTGYGGGDQQQTPRRREGAPATKLQWIEQLEGELIWGDERRRCRRTEVRSPDLHGQKREREEAEQMPHMAVAETAGARRNRAARSSAIRNCHRGEGIRVSTSDRVRERVRGAAGWAELVRSSPLGLT